MNKRPMESYCLGEIYIYSDTDSIKCLNIEKHFEQIARHNRKIALQTISDAKTNYKNGEMTTADYMTICNICLQLAEKWGKVVTAINAD